MGTRTHTKFTSNTCYRYAINKSTKLAKKMLFHFFRHALLCDVGVEANIGRVAREGKVR